MSSQEIRRHFLRYFKEQHHKVVSSSPVVPHDDPTLLFNNAGMNQFKDVFLGKSTREYTRAATSQKCIRVGGKHNDLDNVGHTSRHLTFFEMLGNFSFGDYFKEKAITYAWEVSTRVFSFPEEKIWVTVYHEDEEAYELWKKLVPVERLVRLGEKDNFWAMGDTGPCGPCSELLFDRGSAYGTASSPKEDLTGERYLEFWNLVFMQFNRSGDASLSPLPKQSIDTGAGLERVVSLKMGVDNVFATDILRELIAQIEQVSGKGYSLPAPSAPAFHVIADHLRSLCFAIADGVQPSNLDRGYVLRKLLRRAVRYGRTLGLQEPFLAKVFPRLQATMGEDYPELSTAATRITEILTLEEESFYRTLKRGGNILNQVIEKAQSSPHRQISGEEAFKLKDTYGFPLEEILLIAKDSAVEVNLEAYQLLEEEAKERSRQAKANLTQEIEENLFKQHLEQKGKSLFVGYEQKEVSAQVQAILVEGSFIPTLHAGQTALILLDKTPFYPEKGGQVGDTGTLFHKQARFQVKGCYSPYPDVIAHLGVLEEGTLSTAETLTATVDGARRSAISKNHTATHLLHWALQTVLGAHIRQAGSLVESDRLRFDFSHHKALTSEEIRQIEEKVNEKIRENQEVLIYEIPYEEVQQQKEIKQFFGDKYGHTVRVVDIAYSKELCGGTHVNNLGMIGLFRIVKEGSIAAGIRRIEATTGKAAEEFMYQNENLASAAASLVKTTPDKLPQKVASLLEETKALTLELKACKRKLIRNLAQELAPKALPLKKGYLLAQKVTLEGEELLFLTEELFTLFPSSVLLLATLQEERCQLFLRISSDLTQQGILASQLIKEIAPCIQGSGGGKADSAQAGGKYPEGLPQAFQKIQELLQ